MDVDEILEFFQFPKRDICISTARCKCTIYIFTCKSIKVVIRTEFINMTVLLSMQAFFLCFFLPEAEFNSFLGNTSCNKTIFITMSEIELVFRRAGRRCGGSLFSMLIFKKLYWMQIFNQYL